MPVSIITTPKGEKFRVEHPEGATQDEILARIRGASPDQAQPPMPDMDEQRVQMGSGNTLQFGYPGLTPVFDTDIGMPQELTEGLAGMGRRFSEIGSLGTHETPQEAAALLDDSGYATAGGVLADLTSLLAGGSVLRSLGAGNTLAANVLTRPQTLGQALTGGAVYGGATSNDRVTGALSGGIGGGVGHGITTTLGRLAAPEIEGAAKAMIDKGATLTPGELLGGYAKQLEDSASSLGIPVLGDAIRGAQRRSLTQYSRGVVEDALKPIGKSLDPTMEAGADAIGNAQSIISREFDDVLEGMNVKLDQQFIDEVKSLRALVQELPEKEANEFDRILNRDVTRRFDNENRLMLGRTFKEADTNLRQTYQSLEKGNHYEQQLGKAFKTLQASLLDMGRRQNPDLAPKLDAAKQSYAMMKRIEDAANYVGAKDRVFTPSHMLNAIKKNTDKARFARGEGFDQKSTEAVKGILAQSVPDSGTPTRAVAAGLLLGGGPFIAPEALAGILAAAAMYTRPGQKVVQGALASRPEFAVPLRKALEKSAPYVGILGIGAGLNAK